MGTITKTDAAELKALLNQKRELLQEQLSARRNEIRSAVREQILSEYTKQMETFGREVAKLRRRSKSLEERVQTAVGRIEAAYSIEKVNLNRRFVDLREQLVTMSLDGDAKDFLAKIPTVDEILPLPNGTSPSMKELVAA